MADWVPLAGYLVALLKCGGKLLRDGLTQMSEASGRNCHAEPSGSIRPTGATAKRVPAAIGGRSRMWVPNRHRTGGWHRLSTWG